MDAAKLEKWFKAAAAPLVALTAFVGGLAAAFKGLKPWLETTFGEQLAPYVGIGVSIALALGGLWLTRGVLQTRSKLLRAERFDLRVSDREGLLGRDKDIDNLLTLLGGTDLLFLEGESGSGKSSLVKFGLAPELLSSGDSLPAIVSAYPGDWDADLSRAAFEAFRRRLSDAHKSTVGAALNPKPPTKGTSEAKAAAQALLDLVKAIRTSLQLKPCLILDQFDDYQRPNAEQFIDDLGAFISPDALCAGNEFWRAIGTLLKDKQLSLVVVTRHDAVGGLQSVQLAKSVMRPVARLETVWVTQFVSQAVEPDGKGDVIGNPEDGWTALRARIEDDLKAGDLFLPQQVRLAFLGLRWLKALTPGDYRSAGGLRGLEALYIEGAIKRSAGVSGLEIGLVRALLMALVDPASDGGAKTQTRSDTDLKAIVDSDDLRRKALAELESDELVRAVLAGGGDGWRLDHDSLAGAVLAEERRSNRVAAMLRDREAVWRQAGSNWVKRFNAFLPLTAQVSLLWRRFTPGSGFRYGGSARFAAFSTARLAPWIIAAVIAVVGMQSYVVGARANDIIVGLGGTDVAPLQTLWGADETTRARVEDRMFADPNLLKSRDPSWVAAVAALSPTDASRIIQRAQAALARKGLEKDHRLALLAVMGVAAGRTTPEEARAVARQMIRETEGLDHTEANLGRFEVGFSQVVGAMAPADAEEALAELQKNWRSSKRSESWSAFIARLLGSRLNEQAADQLTARLKRGDLNNAVDIASAEGATSRISSAVALEVLFDIYEGKAFPGSLAFSADRLGDRLSPSDVGLAVENIKQKLSQNEPWPRFWSITSVISHLTPDQASSLSAAIRGYAAKMSPSSDQGSSLLALNALAGLVSPQEASQALTLFRNLAIEYRAPGQERELMFNEDALTKGRLLFGLRESDGYGDPALSELTRRLSSDWTKSSEIAIPDLISSLTELAPSLHRRSAAEIVTLVISKIGDEQITPRWKREDYIRLVSVLATRLDDLSADTDGEKKLLDMESQLSPFRRDANVRAALIDAYVPLARQRLKSDPHDRKAIQWLLLSVAVPYRGDGMGPADSPAWAVLEEVAGERFNGSISRLEGWAAKQGWTAQEIKAGIARGRPVVATRH